MDPSTKDEIKGSLDEVKGKVKETAGKVTNNPSSPWCKFGFVNRKC